MKINYLLIFLCFFFLILAGASFSQQKIVISPEEICSGELTTIEIKIFPDREIKERGEIRIYKLFKIFHGFIKTNYKNIYVNRSDLASGGGIEKRVTIGTNSVFSVLEIKLTGKSLPEDGFVSVVLGDEENKVYADIKNQKLRLPVGFVYQKDGEENMHLFPVEFRILSGKPSDIIIVGPSFGEVNESLEIIICALDKRKNVGESYARNLEISVFSCEGMNYAGYQKEFKMNPLKEEGTLQRNVYRIFFSDPGIYYIMAEDKADKIKNISNPIKISETKSPRKIYWGDIHLHTLRSDGKGEAEDCYQDGYAKGMDFIAITDHSFGMCDRGELSSDRFSQVVEDAERFNRPGHYVVIPAGEVHWLPETHLNLYFSGSEIKSFLADVDCFFENFDWTEFKKKYNKFPLAFTHHSLWRANIDNIDDERMRLIEIYSMYRSMEVRSDEGIPERFRRSEKVKNQNYKKFSVREALNEGKILGIIASSDSHSGKAGEFALAAVWSPELTREGILNALYNRSCYGTTGNRTIIEFTLNGKPMGSIIPRDKTEKLDFDVFVAGDGLINRIDIIGNGKTVHSVDGKMTRIVSFQWKDEIPEFPAYYFLRVVLEKGMAWSSPVWLR